MPSGLRGALGTSAFLGPDPAPELATTLATWTRWSPIWKACRRKIGKPILAAWNCKEDLMDLLALHTSSLVSIYTAACMSRSQRTGSNWP